MGVNGEGVPKKPKGVGCAVEFGAGAAIGPGFGTENVNCASFNAKFSSWRRDRRSRKFVFSASVASFFASRAATWSSNWER